MGHRPAEIERAADGSVQFWSSRFGEHYHNRNGPLIQARLVFLEGTESHRASSLRILEIGFGLGLNFLLTLAFASERDIALDYRAYEIDPQPADLLEELAHKLAAGDTLLWRQLLSRWPGALHEEGSPRSTCAAVSATVGKQCASITFADASRVALPKEWAGAVYLDGFSPAVNPELWTEAFIAQLADSLAKDGWIATYSAAGALRRALVKAGLRVERCGGLPGKREWLRAQK